MGLKTDIERLSVEVAVARRAPGRGTRVVFRRFQDAADKRMTMAYLTVAKS